MQEQQIVMLMYAIILNKAHTAILKIYFSTIQNVKASLLQNMWFRVARNYDA